ncbi:hypothetical protein [Thermogemmatispora carboxidivorans]|uniref:hypothetical protein n=1 Tax=Thermogemmatispora carboxidivorans TaxID=1382306 RepID=UPI00069ACE0C|nr:hypothetical protein [Thermogemmatispora carboxidivorans]
MRTQPRLQADRRQTLAELPTHPLAQAVRRQPAAGSGPRPGSASAGPGGSSAAAAGSGDGEAATVLTRTALEQRRAARAEARRAMLAMVTTLPLRRLGMSRRSGTSAALLRGEQTGLSWPGLARRRPFAERLLWFGGTLVLLVLTAVLAWTVLLRSSVPLSRAWQGTAAPGLSLSPPAATLSPGAGPGPGPRLVRLDGGSLFVGGTVRVAGSGFSAFAPVRFWLDGHLTFVDGRGWPLLIEADGAGHFTVALHLLPQWPPGRHALLARDLQTGQVAELALLLEPAPRPSATPSSPSGGTASGALPGRRDIIQ